MKINGLMKVRFGEWNRYIVSCNNIFSNVIERTHFFGKKKMGGLKKFFIILFIYISKS